MVHEILQRGDPRLHEVSAAVEQRDLELARRVWRDLRDTLTDIKQRHYFRRSAGISAVQIGVPLRTCVIWTPEIGQLELANPTVKRVSDKKVEELEGCLSFFDKRGLVPRPEWIELEYLDSRLERQQRYLEGAAARIALHEMDHMDGILYFQRMRAGEELISSPEYERVASLAIA